MAGVKPDDIAIVKTGRFEPGCWRGKDD